VLRLSSRHAIRLRAPPPLSRIKGLIETVASGDVAKLRTVINSLEGSYFDLSQRRASAHGRLSLQMV
jgi:hypothetical protein